MYLLYLHFAFICVKKINGMFFKKNFFNEAVLSKRLSVSLNFNDSSHLSRLLTVHDSEQLTLSNSELLKAIFSYDNLL